MHAGGVLVGLTTLAIGAGMLVSLVRGGRLGRLADSELRWTLILITGFGLQALIEWDGANDYMDAAFWSAILVVSYGLVLAWLVANRHMRGSILVLIGFMLNAIVITANGAMPVDVEAIRAAGVSDTVIPLGKHEVMTDATSLPWLGDRFPILPLRSSISIGDIVLAAGMIPLVHDLMMSQPARERRRAKQHDSQTATG